MTEIFNSELFGTIMQILIPVLATAIGGIITAVGARIASYIKERAALTKEKKVGEMVIRYTGVLEQAVYDVVQGLNQTTVLQLKEAAADGKLSPDEIEKISADAKATVLAILGPKGIEVLSMAFNDLQTLIACKIERTVLEVKA